MHAKILAVIDWFIPSTIRERAADHGLARIYVFTHLSGPALAQCIVLTLRMADKAPCWAFNAAWALASSFWLMPFLLRRLGRLELLGYASAQLLTFVVLFASFFYGGIRSPFLALLLVAMLVGFFYVAHRPLLVFGSILAQFAAFAFARLVFGAFPLRVEADQLAGVSVMSAITATSLVWWMSMYYGSMIRARRLVQLEAERLRDARARLADAQRASRVKSVFLAKMSHRLRTPLNAVIGYSALLLEQRAESENERIARDLESINAAGRHLLRLVDEELNLENIEANAMSVRPETFKVGALLDDVLAAARPLFAANGNALTVSLDPSVGDAHSDGAKLRQILFNLIGNAAKFTRKGRIAVAVSRQRRAGADWLRFEIRDTGPGIAEHDLERLFGAFEQAPSDARAEGAGLGLAISRRLAALLGGSISAESQLGKGSTFALSIPAVCVKGAVEAA